MGGESSSSSSSSNIILTTTVNTPVITPKKPSKPWTERDISIEEERALDTQFNKLKNSKLVPIHQCKYLNSKKNHPQKKTTKVILNYLKKTQKQMN